MTRNHDNRPNGREPRRSRRGANAIEFALVAPILVAILSGLMDYGWYFWRESLVLNGMREASRAGGMQHPGEAEGIGVCADCIASAKSSAEAALTSLGYTGLVVTPTVERIPATGTPCTYAVVIDTEIAHTRIFPLVPGPEEFDLRMVSMAQNLPCE
ncbi:MAG: TadE/TadG family type IV pilus assembly protein [Myxococcota bacterium]